MLYHRGLPLWLGLMEIDDELKAVVVPPRANPAIGPALDSIDTHGRSGRVDANQLPGRPSSVFLTFRVRISRYRRYSY